MITIIIIIIGYLVTLLLSGPIVRHFVGPDPSIQTGNKDNAGKGSRDVGALIGKCENILALTFILAGGIDRAGYYIHSEVFNPKRGYPKRYEIFSGRYTYKLHFLHNNGLFSKTRNYVIKVFDSVKCPRLIGISVEPGNSTSQSGQI